MRNNKIKNIISVLMLVPMLITTNIPSFSWSASADNANVSWSGTELSQTFYKYLFEAENVQDQDSLRASIVDQISREQYIEKPIVQLQMLIVQAQQEGRYKQAQVKKVQILEDEINNFIRSQKDAYFARDLTIGLATILAVSMISGLEPVRQAFTRFKFFRSENMEPIAPGYSVRTAVGNAIKLSALVGAGYAFGRNYGAPEQPDDTLLGRMIIYAQDEGHQEEVKP